MVQAVAYPNCCGGAVITGFTGAEADVVRDFLVAVQGLPKGRIINFVLNQDQINRYPILLEAAANLGFVISASFVNDVHGSDLVEFQRCGKRRRSILEAARLMNWPGQVIHAGMHGELPNFDQRAPNNNNTEVIYRDGGNNILRVGDRVQIVSPTSRFNRQVVTVIGFEFNYAGVGVNRYYIRFNAEAENVVQRIVAGNVRRVEGNAQQQAPFLYNERPVIAIEGEALQPAARVVFSSFHNHYARDGRRGAGYDTLDLATAAAPRCRRRDRRDVYSDGRIEWVENVQ